MMKVDPALHHNRVGKQGREQSRTKETDYEGDCRDESKSMPELAPKRFSRHVSQTVVRCISRLWPRHCRRSDS
jgi:hypothetical protein